MASFCEQCAKALGFECGDFRDICDKYHFTIGMPWLGFMENKG